MEMNEQQAQSKDHGGTEDVMDAYLNSDRDGEAENLEPFDRFLTWAITGVQLPKSADVFESTSDTPPPTVSEAPLSSTRCYDDTGRFQDTYHESTRDEPLPRKGHDAVFRHLQQAYDEWPLKERIRWGCEFRILEEIGRGGQGVVYLIDCLNSFFGQRALKALSPLPYASADEYTADMQRLAKVAAIVHQNWHNSLLQVERFEQLNGLYYMVMRLIDGFDLQHLLRREVVNGLAKSLGPNEWQEFSPVVFGAGSSHHVRLQPGVAVNIIQQCLRGVSALHDRDIVHCDIKPSNIMIDGFGAVRLIDICSAYKQSSPPARRAWTPRYAPPEVLLGDKGSPQSDLASLGYVLIELLTGRPDVLVQLPGGDLAAASELADLDSVHDLDQASRVELAEVKRQLPARLAELIPVRERKSNHLIALCSRLIDPDPNKRFENADRATWEGTHKFLDELHVAKLAAYWAEYNRRWVKAVKRSGSQGDTV